MPKKDDVIIQPNKLTLEPFKKLNSYLGLEPKKTNDKKEDK
jgi:hypothetical protein